MSEAHVQSGQDIAALVDSTNSYAVEQNDKNYLANKSKEKLNNNNNDDDLIEEFDFSDSDLVELGNESDSASDNRESNCAESKNNKNNNDIKNTLVDTCADNIDNKTLQPHSNGTLTASSTTITNDSTKAITSNYNNNNAADNSTVSISDSPSATTSDSSIGTSSVIEALITIDSDKQVPNATADKRKTAPANLVLSTDASTEDAYCPITPRRLVDIEPEDEAPLLLRSGTKTSIREQGKEDAVTPGTQENAVEQSDNNEHDTDDDPDDELLQQFFDASTSIAEARLAARRQARAEAREIRMRELERQQKEQEQNADRVFDMQNASGIDPLSRSRLAAGVNSSPIGSLLNSARGNSMSSRRSSEDSLEEEGRSLRDIRHELKDVEERYRKAMIANAQLDNERASQAYQIQLFKDKLEEMEESFAQLQRELKEKSRDCNALKRNLDKFNEELKLVKGQLDERDALIADQGLVIVAVENKDGTDAKCALVSVENAQLLGSVQGSLDVRLKKFSEEKQQLQMEVQQLQEQLQNYKSQGKGRGSTMNGPLGSEEDYEAQREANKIISDYKYKLQKAEQEIASLQASLARSETQVIRYKSTAEAAEKAEAELKIERRKLQRENRETMERLEELETSNNHLLKRLDKLKNAKSALLKDL